MIRGKIKLSQVGIAYIARLEVGATSPDPEEARRRIIRSLLTTIVDRLHKALDLIPRDPYGAMREIGELIADIEKGDI